MTWRSKGLWRSNRIRGLEIWTGEQLYLQTWEIFAAGQTPGTRQESAKLLSILRLCMIRW